MATVIMRRYPTYKGIICLGAILHFLWLEYLKHIQAIMTFHWDLMIVAIRHNLQKKMEMLACNLSDVGHILLRGVPVQYVLES